MMIMMFCRRAEMSVPSTHIQVSTRMSATVRGMRIQLFSAHPS